MSDCGIDERLQQVHEALEAVHDPHVPVSLREMGMLESVQAGADGTVSVVVRMPCMACPGAAKIIDDVETIVSELRWVKAVKVSLAWQAGWTREMVGPSARDLMRRNGIVI
ncbi:MAG: metal-sulfur cluster assembly factor [Burkholderiales bacterium]|nr:metal-sulfur cluster assembly factor [Burkholderiales bacterium]